MNGAAPVKAPVVESAPLPLRLPFSLRILADDLTGALDSAAAFGAGVPVYLDQPPLDLLADSPAYSRSATHESSAVSVVATATRDADRATLPGALAACAPWLRDAGLAFKKVDSLLRGNTLEEVRWLAVQGGFTRVIMAPAFPAQGRYMLRDHLAVIPASEPPDAQHIQGENVRTALQNTAWPAGCELVLPQVASDADLDGLCAHYLQADGRTLWCGSAGLAAALARRWGCTQSVEDNASSAISAGSTLHTDCKLWVIGASHQPVTQRQWARAMAAYPQALTVRNGNPLQLDAAAKALSGGANGLALVNLSPSTPLGTAEAAVLLQSQVAQLTQSTAVPARLLVIGGDTVRALAMATGVQHMVSGTPARPGWGRAQWRGGRWSGVWMDCRSGAFGDDGDLLAAMAAVAAVAT
jgi:D-threonate/D-erythronate kinase